MSDATRWLQEARDKLLANAHDLLDEADLLLGHGKVARAFALGQIASEEMAKALMLVGLEVAVRAGDTTLGATFLKNTRSHTSKTEGMLTLDHAAAELLQGYEPPHTFAPQVVEKIRKLARDLASLKNAALYVDVMPDGVGSPSEYFTVEWTRRYLTGCARRLQLCRELLAPSDLPQILDQLQGDVERALREKGRT